MAIIFFLAFLVVPPIPISPTPELPRNAMANSLYDLEGMNHMPIERPSRNVKLSDQTLEGVLNPILVEQVGYVVSGPQTARTDINPEPTVDLPLDEAHSWLASSAEISISKLTNLYALNGTFEDGLPGNNINPDGSPGNYPFGWTAVSTSTNYDQIQLAGYDDSGRTFMIVQNYGKATNNPQHEYTHYAGTSVLLNQSIEISPYTEDFVLSFDYLYYQGPLGSSFTGNCSIQAFIDGVMVWRQHLPSLAQRGVWYSTNEIPVNLAVTNTSTMFELGLVIDETFMADGDSDYDDNGLPDGNANTQYITVQFDDVSLVRAAAPSPDEVDLQFHAGSEVASIIGSSGTGSSSIANASYWVEGPVSVSVTSNSSVSFNYEAKLRSHRFSNSTWATNAARVGVHYSAIIGESPSLTLHTYVGFLGDYQDLSMKLWYPDDWENVTVLDPFLSDVTSSCTIGTGTIEIPTSLIDRLGWWSATLESPNYAKTMDTQLYNPLGPGWESNTVFRSTNRTRVSVNIGTDTDTPESLSNVNFTWALPNGTLWYAESINGGLAGSIDSSGLTVGQANSSAGLWSVNVQWSNGTEVAFDEAAFEVHHSASLSPADSSIETETGVVLTVFLDYLDNETRDFLMDPAASMTANWSLSTITFQPNDGRNQWEADFDTGLFPPGLYLVVVNVTRTYFDDASCTFTISSNRTGNTLSLADTTKNLDLHQTYSVSMRYEDRYGLGIEGASFTFEIVDGIDGGITWGGVTEGSGGDYSVEFYSVYSATYEISISASKDHYESDQDTLFIFVGVLNSSFTLLNGSVQAIQYGEDFELFLRYTNGTGHGLDGADITVVDPPSNLIVSETQNLTDGLYSITFTPTLSEPFTILIQASIVNHRTQIASFTLSVNPISSTLELNYTSSIIALDEQCIIHLNLTSSLLGPLAGGEIQVLVNPSDGMSLSDYEDLGGGIYRIIAIPNRTGIFSLNFLASAVNHRDSPNAFTLLVVEIGTEVVGTGPVDALYYGRSYSFTYEYKTLSSQIGIEGASSSASGVGSDWFTLVDLGSGKYNITVVPEDVGSFSSVIEIRKSGFQRRTITFSFLVRAIPINVQLDIPSWIEGQPLGLTVTLTDDLGLPVIDAEVIFELYQGVSLIDGGFMDDDDNDGVYMATINLFPDIRLNYDVLIAVSKVNHETPEPVYQSAVILLETSEGLIWRLWTNYGIQTVGALTIIGIVGASYRIRSKRRAAYMAKALIVKRRFDDVNNFIGIVILHKTSGLPVYSNVLKGGFEEGMISAFITAITHFRSEFDREEDDHTFEVLPISDIMRAVPTKNLVCAFITVSTASMQQEARMVEFAKGVSKLMDDDLEVRPTEVNNVDITQLLERYFDEVMDGFLLRYYKRGIAGDFPRKYRCLEEALDFTEAADCSRPVYLANVMTDHCRITEAEASLLVLQAIKLELIVPCGKHEVQSFTRAHWEDTDESKHLPDGPVRM